MHNLVHYDAIPCNKTFSSLSNYTCNDADGCLERQGSCYKNIWTVLDDVVPLKVTDFRREPPEIYFIIKKWMENSSSAYKLSPRDLLSD